MAFCFQFQLRAKHINFVPAAGFLSRMGKQEGFTNVRKAQVHSIATQAMLQTAFNIHEQVPEFDEAGADYFWASDFTYHQSSFW